MSYKQKDETPESWSVEFDETAGYDAMWAGYRITAPDHEICTVDVINYVDDGRDYEEIHSRNDHAEAHANLIGAAPNLLADLEEATKLVAFLANHLAGRIGEGMQADMLDKAEAWCNTIEKAKGEDIASS